MDSAIFVHIVGGSVGLLTGYAAVFSSKGKTVHRKSGVLFVASMLVMALSGAGIAAITGVVASVIAGLLTTYLVITSFATIRPMPYRWMDIVVIVLGLTVGVSSMIIGLRSLVDGQMVTQGIPIPMLFLFGAVGLLGSLSDIRILRKGPLQGNRRISRHLWRMCFALFIASGSFFLGQSDEIPERLRITPILAGLAFLPLALMVFWLMRVRLGRRTFTDSTLSAPAPPDHRS